MVKLYKLRLSARPFLQCYTVRESGARWHASRVFRAEGVPEAGHLHFEVDAERTWILTVLNSFRSDSFKICSTSSSRITPYKMPFSFV